MTKPTSEPSDPICPTCKKPITDEDAVMHHNCLPPSEPRVELLTTNETSSKPVVPEPNQKPPSGPPREFWLRQYSQDGGRYSDIRVMKPSDCDLGVSPPPGHDNLKYYDEVHVIEKSAFDAVVAELAEAKERERGDINQLAAMCNEVVKLRSACEMLAAALNNAIKAGEYVALGSPLEELRDFNGRMGPAREALAQYEALKRQLAGEEK